MKKGVTLPILFVLSLSVLASLSCSFRQKMPPIRTYVIDTGHGVKQADKAAKKRIPLTLVLRNVDGPFLLKTRKIFYKTSKASQNSYAYSRWVDSPERMLYIKFLKAIDAAGIFSAVTPLYSRAMANISLETFIFDFSQHINPDGSSFGVISVTFQLVDINARKIIAAKSFVTKKPAPTTDAKGAVVALNDAADELCAGLVAWLSHIAKSLPVRF